MGFLSNCAILLSSSAILFADDCGCKKYQGMEGHLFPSIPCLENPCNPCGIVYSADASFLYWQAREDGLEFAIKSKPDVGFGVVDVDGTFVGIDFDWNPAVKVNLDLAFPSREWDFGLRWTFYYSHSDRSASSPVSGASTGLFPVWISGGDIAESAHGSWQLHFNAFDLALGFNPFLSPALSLHVDAGLKVFTIDQHFHVNYQGGTINLNPTVVDAADSVFRNFCWGIGPRIGFDSKWRLGSGFSFLGTIAGALPLCEFHIKRNDHIVTELPSPAPLETLDIHFRERFWTFRPVLEMALGIGWDACYGCRNQYSFGVGANYEFQYFWEQNMMALLLNNATHFMPFQPRGDLNLHGVTLTFHFGY